MRLSNIGSMDAVLATVRLSVTACALLTMSSLTAPAGAVVTQPNVAAAPWRAGFAGIVQKVRPAVFSIRVKIMEDVGHGNAKPRTGASEPGSLGSATAGRSKGVRHATPLCAVCLNSGAV